MIDVRIALIAIAGMEFVTWLTSTVPNNLTAGLIVGLALYCLIRTERSRRE